MTSLQPGVAHPNQCQKENCLFGVSQARLPAQSFRLPVRCTQTGAGYAQAGADRSDKNFNPQNSNVFLRLKI